MRLNFTKGKKGGANYNGKIVIFLAILISLNQKILYACMTVYARGATLSFERSVDRNT